MILALACPQEARAGGVVSVCNEAGLKAAVFGGGTVTFICSGTITVLGGTITISTDTTIDGTGQTITISGGGEVQLFMVNTGITLSLKGLTVADGYVSGNGGGVMNLGTLKVSNSTFKGNAASATDNNSGGDGGGICNDGYLTVTNSTFEGNTASAGVFLPGVGDGGGIFNDNDATISNSTFHGNQGVSGGGIFTGSQSGGGLLVLNSSVFYNNQSTGLYDNAYAAPFGGGGLYNQGFITVVTNSTFFGNGGKGASGGNIFNCCNNKGTALLDNDTISGGIGDSGVGGNLANVNNLDANPGSAPQGGALFAENTIVANAASGSNCFGTFTDLGGNLRWPTRDATCLGSYGDPKLGTLANYGGPTWTLALQPGSAAINTAIESFCPGTDQRGVLRPQGPQCDIGAFEYSTSRLQGLGVIDHLDGFLDSLLSEAASDKLGREVIRPLRDSLNPDLWPGSDGNHITGSEVFVLQGVAVDRLSRLIIDPRQLAYINNLVMADRNLAQVAMNDEGCFANPNPGPTAGIPPGPCVQATAELAAGDTAAGLGEYADAIGHYLNAWQFSNP
jgi:hypothetical protein